MLTPESHGPRRIRRPEADRGPRGSYFGTRSRSFVNLELLGADRPGIVHMVTEVLAVMGINVEDLETACLRAPMCGDPLFKVSARLGLPEEANIDDLREALEALADELMVDLTPASDLAEQTEASLVL